MKTGRRAGAWRFPGSEGLPQEILIVVFFMVTIVVAVFPVTIVPVMFLVVVPFSLFAAIGSLLENNTTRQMAAE
jgi:hypothetical protein